jgi:hypothetical protein
VLGASVERVPDDVLAEHDLEARVGKEEVHAHLTEDSPPADDDDRAWQAGL